MPSIVSFRPGVIGNNSAFEPMAAIYKYLQDHYGYNFTLVHAETDAYEEPELKTLKIPMRDWKTIPSSRFLPPRTRLSNHLKAEFDRADGILTIDPTIFGQSRIAISAAYKAQKPIWFDTSRTIQNDYATLEWTFKRRFWLQSALRQTTGIIATVPKCLERFQELGLLDGNIAKKFTVMGHPVNTDKFYPLPKSSKKDGILRVLVVSRLVPEKGLYYILEAMDPILRERPDIQLHLLGKGPLRSLLEREVVERNLVKQVIFADTIPHRELPSIMAKSDIFVSHAVGTAVWEEFFGVANLEAMSCGLPCVITTGGGISYAIREDTALFVQERDIIQLRRAISQLLGLKQLRATIGQSARQYVETNYSIDVIAKRYNRMLSMHLENSEEQMAGIHCRSSN